MKVSNHNDTGSNISIVQPDLLEEQATRLVRPVQSRYRRASSHSREDRPQDYHWRTDVPS